MSQIKILMCQCDVPPVVTASARNEHLVELAVKVCTKLNDSSVDLVVLPELSSIDYSRDAFENLSELAEPLDGFSFQIWKTVAQKFNTSVAYSFPRVIDDEYRICIAIIGPDGVLMGHYDKLHLAHYGASMEKDYFSRGQNICVVEINGFKLAPIICYDIRIPELCRTLTVDRGVDVILHSGAYYRDESFFSWHDFAVTRAIENQSYLISLNRAGEHYGHSIFCPPWVDEDHPPKRLDAHKEQFEVVTLDKEIVQQVRKDYSFLKDRLDNYGLLNTVK